MPFPDSLPSDQMITLGWFLSRSYILRVRATVASKKSARLASELSPYPQSINLGLLFHFSSSTYGLGIGSHWQLLFGFLCIPASHGFVQSSHLINIQGYAPPFTFSSSSSESCLNFFSLASFVFIPYKVAPLHMQFILSHFPPYILHKSTSSPQHVSPPVTSSSSSSESSLNCFFCLAIISIIVHQQESVHSRIPAA